MKNEKTKVLFVTPPYHPHNLADHKVYVVEPIQYEVLASLLDPRLFAFELVDLRLDRGPSAFADKLNSFEPDVVGFTSWTMHVDCVLRLAREAKSRRPSVVTIVGGEHTRVHPHDFAVSEIDLIVMGEAYRNVEDIFMRLRDGHLQMPDIPGVAYRDGDGFVSNGEAILTGDFDLNNLPFPDRSIIKPYNGSYYHLWWQPIATVRTAMGCPSRCSFCNLWKVNNGKYLRWEADYVVDYLLTLPEPYVLFVDDHFFGDSRRAFAIGEAIERAGIKKQYCLYSRSDAIARTPDLVELWSRIGLKRVRMGLESYSDVELDSMNKCASVDHNDIAIRTLKKHDVLTEGLFMVGLDYTADDFDALEQYITSREIEVPNITLYTPMPGTPDYYEKRGQMTDTASWYFDFQHATLPTRLPIQEFCQRYARLMMRAQRPPMEQIRRIGVRTFLQRMPNFYRYFWSLRSSHKHYLSKKKTRSHELLPWQESISGPEISRRLLST